MSNIPTSGLQLRSIIKSSGELELSLADMQGVEPRITNDVYAVLGVENSVKSRTSYGGTAPQNVAKMAKAWKKRLDKQGAGG